MNEMKGMKKNLELFSWFSDYVDELAQKDVESNQLRYVYKTYYKRLL